MTNVLPSLGGEFSKAVVVLSSYLDYCRYVWKREGRLVGEITPGSFLALVPCAAVAETSFMECTGKEAQWYSLRGGECSMLMVSVLSSRSGTLCGADNWTT